MAGNGCLATAFHAEISRERHAGRDVPTERLAFMTENAKSDHTIPTLLATILVEQGDYVGALGAFRQARDRVLLGLESRPDDPLLTEELDKLSIDIADCEVRL